MNPGLIAIVVLGILALGLGPGVAIPAAIALWVIGRPAGPRRRRRARKSRTAKHRFDGTLEVWDLRSVRIRLDAHRVDVRSHARGARQFNLHELLRVELDGRELVFVPREGRPWRSGPTRISRDSLHEAHAQLVEAIGLRRRGTLEDKLQMEAELRTVRPVELETLHRG